MILIEEIFDEGEKTRTIACLDVMQVNNSALFESLLQHHPPFVEAWTKAGYALSELSEVGTNISP